MTARSVALAVFISSAIAALVVALFGTFNGISLLAVLTLIISALWLASEPAEPRKENSHG